MPVASFVLDFFVHGMWAHRGVDAHLLLHPAQAARLEALGGRNPVICGPVVRPIFQPGLVGANRVAARQSLGLRSEQRCAVVVAGSWGVGNVMGALQTLQSERDVVPVVVTGHNRRLRESLLSQCSQGWRGLVFGWVEEMGRLLAAADVVVENAGGLTAMEAMAAGVPVVTYSPIAGHGRANAEEMAAAGVSLYARSPAELVSHVRSVTSSSPLRRRVVSAGRSMFDNGSDAAVVLAHWARTRSTRSLPTAREDQTAPGTGRPRQPLLT